MADGVWRAVAAGEFAPGSVVGAPADNAGTDTDGVEPLPGDDGYRHRQVAWPARVSRRYVTGGLMVPIIHRGIAAGEPVRMITPTPRRNAAGDQQSCRDPRATGVLSDAQYTQGSASTSASQPLPPDPPVAINLSARAGPGWKARSHVTKIGPRPQFPAVERDRVPQLGPARVNDGLDHARPARSTSPTNLLPAAATGLRLTSRPSDIRIAISVTSGRTIPNRAFQAGGPALPRGGTVVLDENPCIVKSSNSWIIYVSRGAAHPRQAKHHVVDYEPGDTTSIFLNWRVADIPACYEDWKSKGAQFVTPPIDRGAEIRCHMRDPDGYLIEAGQSTGLLHGQLAAKRPEDLPG